MKRTKRVLALTTLTSLLLVGAVAAAPTWSPAGNLTLARITPQATLLADGRVLVTGGNTNVGNTYDTKSAEVYDPSTNAWSSTGSTTNGRTDHTATRLLDGKVLVAGGENANICTNDVTTELYDPSTGTWSSTGNANVARTGATAALLTNGKVLLAGGGNRCGTVFASAELYDPGTGSWSPTGSMTTGREWASAVRLSDGRVLVAGGEGPNPFPALGSAEIYDPATGTWTATGSMPTARCCNGGPFLARLSDGRVLAAGAQSGFANFVVPNGPSVEIYNPATGLWTPTGSMSVGRAGGTFSLLNDGRVLAAGGSDATATYSSAELWDPGTGTWSITASLANARGGHTGTVLANGNVLVATGYDTNTSSYLNSAELYSLGFSFSGFFAPVDNPPVFNLVKAGSGIPVKFSLGGNQGLNIFAAGYPRSEQIVCDTSATLDDIEQTVTAGGSGLSYDAATNQYVYTWKTDKAWANSCRKLTVRLTDNSDHIAYFKFSK
jgi:N-acetylneuraminic acid mutarotase